MKAGSLRHGVTLQELNDGLAAPLPSGAPDQYWADLMTVSASIDPLSGRELFAAQQYSSEVTHRVVMRYRAGITPDLRIKFGERYFTIHVVLNPAERNKEIELLCSEGLAVQTA